MKYTIILFILDAIKNNPNDQMLGEEIRALKETIYDLISRDFDEVLDYIHLIICSNPNDQELGEQMRRTYIPLKKYINAKQNFTGDSNQEQYL
jgi:hypothetical protein